MSRKLVSLALLTGMFLAGAAAHAQQHAGHKMQWGVMPKASAETPAGAEVQLWEGLGPTSFTDHDQGPDGAEVFQPGPRVRLRLQPLGGAARVPGGPEARSGMRDVLLGRGARARPEHQLADGSGGDRARLQGRHRGAAAGAQCEREGAGADRRARQALRRRTRPPTASRSTSPMPTRCRRSRSAFRTISTSPRSTPSR